MNGTAAIQRSLYEKLGSMDGIKALVEDIVDAHMQNPVIKARFLPYTDDPENFSKIKHHLCYFLASGCGGPEKYEGRDMVTTHRGMNINEAEYMAVIDDILKILDKHQIDTETKKEILAIAYSLKGDIMYV